VNEVDDRLAGDLVWELFPTRSGGHEPEPLEVRLLRWALLACLVAAAWWLAPPLGVVTACIGIAAPDFHHAWKITRCIPDKAGGTIIALFACAWGAWKSGLTAVVFLFLSLILWRKQSDVPPAFVTSVLMFAGGYLLSAVLTAVGLVRAYRTAMRVWVGEGANRARTLLLGMLIVGFTIGVLGPLFVWLAKGGPAQRDSPLQAFVVLAAVLGLEIIGPIIMLFIVDWLSRHVVADSPSKLGPKVSAVGKI
jgi:hypothetical protein